MGVAAAKEFPYEIKDVVSSYEGKSLWKLNFGLKKVLSITNFISITKTDKSPVSIFSFDTKKNPAKTPTAQNYLKRIKTLRHPNILTFIDGMGIDPADPNGTGNIHIVTEEVVPLGDYLSGSSAFGSSEIKKTAPASIYWGIFQLAKAVSFLNNECKMVHGNVTMSSVFVNKAGDWKLAGFDLISPLNDPSSPLKAHNDIVSTQCKSPEYMKNNWSALDIKEESTTCNWGIDSWMFACLIYEIYNGSLSKIEDLKKVANIPKGILPLYQQMLSSAPSSRLNTLKVLDFPFLVGNSYVETFFFLENIALKDSFDKEKFFKKLAKVFDDLGLDSGGIPPNTCKYKLLPHLVSALDYSYGNTPSTIPSNPQSPATPSPSPQTTNMCAYILGPLLKIGKLLTSEEYNSIITPSVVRWFASNDRNLRLNLLQNMELFIEYLSTSIVSDQIFPHLANGFNDVASPALREQTVKSMTVIINKLNDKVVNTQLLKYLAKLQMDDEPGIRTNTTICIAKIANNINSQTRKKVLAPAFCRSLRDPFNRTRIAGLLAFLATHMFYNKEECASVIIPAIAPLFVDTDKEVRDNAFKTVDLFIEKLKKISETGIEENTEEVKSESNSGMLNWSFFGNISKKIYGESASSTPTTTNNNPVNTSSNPTSATTTPSTPQNNPRPPVSKSEPKTQSMPKNADSEDEKDEGWDDFEFDSTPKPTQTSKPPVSTPSNKKTPVVTTMKDGWDNDEDDLLMDENPKGGNDGWDDDFDFDVKTTPTPAKGLTKLEQSKAPKAKKLKD